MTPKDYIIMTFIIAALCVMQFCIMQIVENNREPKAYLQSYTFQEADVTCFVASDVGISCIPNYIINGDK